MMTPVPDEGDAGAPKLSLGIACLVTAAEGGARDTGLVSDLPLVVGEGDGKTPGYLLALLIVDAGELGL